MPAMEFDEYADAFPAGVSLTDIEIGSTTHPLALAIPKEDPGDIDNGIPREVYYELLTDSARPVSIGDQVTIEGFEGSITQIEPYPIGTANWSTVRRAKPSG